MDTNHYGGEDRINRHDRCRDLFRTLLDNVIEQGPDALLVAGDLFDASRACEDTGAWAMEALGRMSFPVPMIPGHHGYLEVDNDHALAPGADLQFRRFAIRRVG